MVIELLEDMPSLITEGKTWYKGKKAYLDKDSATALVEAGKAVVVDGEQITREPPKAPKTPKPKA